MGASSFAEFVAKQQPAAGDPGVDWDAERDQFLRQVDRLYAHIAEFLKEFVTDGSTSYRFSGVVLTEENLGTYSVQRMDIQIGRKSIYLDPVGTLLIGSWGRVDIVGPTGRGQIMLLDERATRPGDLVQVRVSIGGSALSPPVPAPARPTLAWKIVARRPQWSFVPLSKDSFFDLVMEIANA